MPDANLLAPVEGVFDLPHAVTPEEIDELRHVNNLRYLEWTQEAAKAHSRAVGWPFSRYVELGGTWVVRAHAIEYLRPALLGDEVVIRTWVTEMGKVHSLRKYRIVRVADETLLATAQTNWVYVKLAGQSLDRIPAELRAAFPVVAL